MLGRLSLGAILFLWPLSVHGDEVDRLLTTITTVKKEGANLPRVRAAWEKLVRQGPAVLPRILAAMNTPDTVVANWLRLAFERIAEPELQAGGKRIDVDALLAFAKDPRRQGRARRLALDVVERLRPGTRAKLLRGWIDDPEFNFDAIEARLDELKRDKDAPKERLLADYRKLFPATRDLDQSRVVARQLKELGVTVSVADHFGFLRDWYLLGPFDARGSKGFRTAYPPESKIDLAATYAGKGGKKLSWRRFTQAETPTGRFPSLINLREPLGEAEDAVAFAHTALKVEKAQEVEFRGSADDNFTVWVNGKRVFGFEEYRNGVRLDRHRFVVPLRAGVNTILVKICQAPFDPNSPDPNWEFLFRLTDRTGKGLVFPGALKAVK
jgi:hypothetical protein